MRGSAPDADPQRRLRRLARRLDALAAARRVRDSAPAILQIVVAVTAAYSVARWGLGHPVPLLSVTVTISALGFSRDARPRRLVETIVGMLVGILLADAVVLLAGRGLAQLVVVLVLALAGARALSRSPAFAVVAGVQSSLVALLPDPAGGPFIRTLDAVIGCLVAVLATALIPRDPRRAARRDGRALYSSLVESTGTVVDALATGDSAAGELALTRLRRTQVLVDDWSTSLDTALSVSRIAPLLRRHLPELRAEARLLAAGDLAARHLRLVARRAEFLVADGRARPELARLTAEAGEGLRLLAAELDDRQLAGAARSLLVDLARRLDPAELPRDSGVADTTVLVLLRPLVVDLLSGTGLPEREARELLPPL